jgi:hypothetical protein
MPSALDPRQGAQILRFPLERVRRVRPQHQPADRAVGGKVVFLPPRLPLRAIVSAGDLPPAA